MRVLIADDEPIARRVLREELERRPDVEMAGEADTGRRTLDQIARLRPDLVFLDLQMPEMNGFEVIRELQGGSHLPVIIIVTAFDQYAMQAFEAGAIDYLLKPVSQSRLDRTMDRVQGLLGNRLHIAENLAKLHELSGERQAAPMRKIVGRLGEEYLILDASEVLAFQADGEVVWIITARRRLLATQTLRSLESKLQGGMFRRVHRNALVNLDHVRKLGMLSSSRWLITLQNNQEFIVSKRMVRNVRQVLNW